MPWSCGRRQCPRKERQTHWGAPVFENTHLLKAHAPLPPPPQSPAPRGPQVDRSPQHVRGPPLLCGCRTRSPSVAGVPWEGISGSWGEWLCWHGRREDGAVECKEMPIQGNARLFNVKEVTLCWEFGLETTLRSDQNSL